MADYGELSDRATNLVEHAKQQEHLVTDEETYKNFENAYLAYKDLHRFIVNNRREVLMMNRKKKHKRIPRINHVVDGGNLSDFSEI